MSHCPYSPLRLVYVEFAQANAFVDEVHRHHGPAEGHRFSIGAMDDRRGVLCGVAMVGRPVAKGIDEDRVVEVNRCATDGTRNACSFLYGAAANAAKYRGFCAIITYTLDEEQGASLRAAGWWGEREAVAARAKGWDAKSRPRPNRPRSEKALGSKTRWLKLLNEFGALPPPAPKCAPDARQLHIPGLEAA